MRKIRQIILETAAERLIELIKDDLKGNKEYKGRYSLPYSDSNDDMVDFIITYHVTKVKLWKTLTPQFSCAFEGTVYISVDNVSVGFEAKAYCNENKTEITGLDLAFVITSWDSSIVP